MVAGLSRKSRNASNHFLPTRPMKQDVSLPFLPEKLGEEHRHLQGKPPIVLRPKNNPEWPSRIPSKSLKKDEKIKNGTKRPTEMTEVKYFPVKPADRLMVNEAKRRYVLRPQIGYTGNNINVMTMTDLSSDDSKISPDDLVVSGILDGITSLCLGPTFPSHGYRSGASHHPCRSQRLTASPRRPKKKVVYPIASYPARLNCKKLVSQRRAVFKQNLFRPVSSDEMSQNTSVSGTRIS